MLSKLAIDYKIPSREKKEISPVSSDSRDIEKRLSDLSKEKHLKIYYI